MEGKWRHVVVVGLLAVLCAAQVGAAGKKPKPEKNKKKQKVEAENHVVVGQEGTVISDVLLGSSRSKESALIFEIEEQPSNGTVSLGRDQEQSCSRDGNWLDCEKPFSYSPQLGFVGKDSFTFEVRNKAGNTDTAKVRIQVLPNADPPPANSSPTSIALSSSTVTERSSANTLVGNLSTTDPDAGDTHTYTLTTVTNQFKVQGNKLLTNDTMPVEGTSFPLTITSTDNAGASTSEDFIISVIDGNDAPTDILVSPATFQENLPVGTEIATLSTTDPDVVDTHTYQLVSGPGGAHNSQFSISGDKLLTNSTFDYESITSRDIRLRSTDAGGLSVEEHVVLRLTDDATDNNVGGGGGGGPVLSDDVADNDIISLSLAAGAPAVAGWLEVPLKDQITGDGIFLNDDDNDGAVGLDPWNNDAGDEAFGFNPEILGMDGGYAALAMDSHPDINWAIAIKDGEVYFLWEDSVANNADLCAGGNQLATYSLMDAADVVVDTATVTMVIDCGP